MNALIIDTSEQSTLCVAIAGDAEYVRDMLPHSGSNTSVNIIPMIDGVLTEGALTVDDLHVVAVVVGPGSFTGLRIGVSVANALYTKGIALFGVNLLQMLAEGEGDVLCALPSRVGYCYTNRGEMSVTDVAQCDSVGTEGTGARRVLSRPQYVAKLIAYVRRHVDDAAHAPVEPLYLKKSQAERLREERRD